MRAVVRPGGGAACRTIAALATTLALAGCARAVDGTPQAQTFPRTVDALTHNVAAAAKLVTSVHLRMTESIGDQAIKVVGDEQLSNGKATALVIDESISAMGGTVRLLRVDGKTYARLPAAQRTSAKPWALVRPGSTNPFISTMANALASAEKLTGINMLSQVAPAITGFRYRGTDRVDGAITGRYAMTIDVDKLPASFPQKELLQQVGLTRLPLQFWVDGNWHTRRMTEALSVMGQHARVVAAIGDYNKPVHITAPPADQVDDS
jgi:hypothetical protein